MLGRAAIVAGLGLLASQADLSQIDIAKQVQGLLAPAVSIVSMIQPAQEVAKPEVRLASSYSTVDTAYSFNTSEDNFCKHYVDYCKEFKRKGGE